MTNNKSLNYAPIKSGEKVYSLFFKDTDNENFEYLIKNNYQYIKYSKAQKFNPDTNYQSAIQEFFADNSCKCFHRVDFILKSFPEFEENIIKLVENFIENKPADSSYSEAIKKIIKFFEKWKNTKKYEKLMGDFGEALFYERCLNLGFKDIEKDAEERFDFIIGKTIFEVKTTKKDNPKIKITDKQITNDVNVVVVKFIESNIELHNEENSEQKQIVNILDVYDLIEKKQGTLPKIFQENKEYYSLDKDLTNSLIINKKEVFFSLYEQEYLPRIDINEIQNNKKILEVIFVLDATSELINENSFNEQLRNKINEKI